MVAVRVVKMVGDAIIHMVAVRHRLMAAAGAVHMATRMPTAAVVRGAAVRVVARDLDRVLVDMIFVRMMEMPVMQIVNMAAMAHGRMSATRPMLMGMIGMGRGRTGGRHGIVSFPSATTADIAVRLSAA